MKNRKVVLGFLTLVLIFAIIIVSSFFPFTLDANRIHTKEFITDQLIIIAITLSATISMMFIAQASNQSNPLSEVAKARVDFVNSMNGIKNHTDFYEWVKNKLQPQDRIDMSKNGMIKIGVDYSVYLLENKDILSLESEQEIDGRRYKALTKKQIQAILELKKRVANTKFVSANYYTSVNSIEVDKTLSEVASKENLKKILTVVFQLSWKIISTLIFSMILASLVRDIAQEGGSTAQAWMRFLSRMFSFISSSFLGYLTGCKINDLDAFYIRKRIEVHILFKEDLEKSQAKEVILNE